MVVLGPTSSCRCASGTLKPWLLGHINDHRLENGGHGAEKGGLSGYCMLQLT